jgi:hypothetical protein
MGIETTLSFLGLSEDFFLQVSGMKFNYDPNQQIGQRVQLGSIRIGGKRFNPAAKYSVTMNQALALLLPVMGVSATLLEPLPDYEYTVVKEYIRSLHLVAYWPEGRIRDVSVKARFDKELVEDIIADATADESSVETVKEFELAQNYPNPFNPSTIIGYTVPVAGHVSLKVYNTIGQEVATLVDAENTSGHYDVTWNAHNLASGVYIYKLEAGQYHDMKKMILVK